MSETKQKPSVAACSSAKILCLPDEICLRILQYLHPIDQMSLAKACKRFKILGYDKTILRKVNLSCSVRTSVKPLIEYFSDKLRTQYITELNFNNCVWAGAKVTLERCIMSCSNLEALHVVHCGFTVTSLFRVFPRLPRLSTLSWSPLNDYSTNLEFIRCPRVAVRAKELRLEQLKNLYFEVEDISTYRVFVGFFISYCTNLEKLHIHLRDEFLDKDDVADYIYWQERDYIYLQNLHSVTLTKERLSWGSGFQRFRPGLEFFVCFVKNAISMVPLKTCKWKTLWLSPGSYNVLAKRIRDTPTAVERMETPEALSVAFHGGEENFDLRSTLLDQVKENTVKHLEFQEALLSATDLNTIARIGGKSLKTLSLYDCGWRSPDEVYALSTVFETCTNITELNLDSCHFKLGDNICKTLAHLRYLTRIQLQACAITKERKSVSYKHPEVQQSSYEFRKRKKVATRTSTPDKQKFQIVRRSPLLPMVENCPHVVEFDVRRCLYLRNLEEECCYYQGAKPCTDADLAPLWRWKKLESLSCIDLPAVRHAKFLESVGENCKYLRTLRISAIGEASYNEFMMSLSNAVVRAQSLRHLRIEHKLLNLGCETLWKMFSEAKKLERICLISHYSRSLNVNMIMKLFDELPGLYVLHLHCQSPEYRKVSEHLNRRLRRDFSTRGINTEIIIENWEDNMYSVFKPVQDGHALHRSDLCLLSPHIALPRKYSNW